MCTPLNQEDKARRKIFGIPETASNPREEARGSPGADGDAVCP